MVLHLATTPTEKLSTSVIAVLFALTCMSFNGYITSFQAGVVSILPFSRPQSPMRPQTIVVELDKFPGILECEPAAKFSSISPHSGFHNQYFALENVLVFVPGSGSVGSKQTD